MEEVEEKQMKKRKIIALILLLCTVTLMFNLVSCLDGGNNSYVNARLKFDNLDKVKEFISTHATEEYLYVALSMNDNKFVIEQKYTVDVIAKLTKKAEQYQMDSAKIEGVFELTQDSNIDNKIEVAFHSSNLYNKLYIDDNSIFEIKAVNNDEMTQLFSSRYEATKYSHAYNYAILINDIAVMHLAISSTHEQNETYLAAICDLVLENIKVIR